MKTISIIIILVCAFGLTGCATTGTQVAGEPSRATKIANYLFSAPYSAYNYYPLPSGHVTCVRQ